jgi:hypothetical protein
MVMLKLEEIKKDAQISCLNLPLDVVSINDDAENFLSKAVSQEMTL